MPNTQAPMWQQIIQDPKALVATVALVTNIAVTVIINMVKQHQG